LGKGEATATSHLFTSLDHEQKGEFSAQKREERGRERILEKNTVPTKQKLPEVWGEQNKSCNQRGKEQHERMADQEVSTAAVNMN